MFIRIGNSIINKNLIWQFIKFESSIIIIKKPMKLSVFFNPEYIISGNEFIYNNENDCSKAFEKILQDNILNDFITEKTYTDGDFIKILKRIHEHETKSN